MIKLILAAVLSLSSPVLPQPFQAAEAITDGGSAKPKLPTTETYLDTKAKTLFRAEVDATAKSATAAYGNKVVVEVETLAFTENGQYAVVIFSETVPGKTVPRLKVSIVASLSSETGTYKPVTDILIGPGKP